MAKTFTVFNDPGHGWLKVTLADVEAIGLEEGDFSPYSYRNGDALYLEEDCDLGIFAKRYQERTGAAPIFKDRHCNNASRIRSYDSVRTSARFAANLAAMGY
jgi:hypothetical protein